MEQTLKDWNARFAGLTPRQRMEEFYRFFADKKILVTSSFGTSSVYLLYLISKVNPNQVIHFLDTTYHFDETQQYREQLIKLYNLNIKVLKPKRILNQWTTKYKAWEHNADLCCQTNKVEALEEIKKGYDMWITGLRRDQSDIRQKQDIFEQDGQIIKFNPVLDVSHDEVRAFAYVYELPDHPLLSKGYESVGCTHCTVKGKGREGRWSGLEKTECGLHKN